MTSTSIIPKPTIHFYREINEGKFKTTKHYELVEIAGGTKKLSDLINVASNRGFAKSSPILWLKIRSGKQWNTLTGLFKTPVRSTFYADKGQNGRKEDLLIVKLSENEREVTIYYFQNYYTADISKVLRFISQTY